MSVKVIGRKKLVYRIDCKKCGCTLEFDESDIHLDSIECPVCESFITIRRNGKGKVQTLQKFLEITK